MEIGAVIGASPKDNVKRECPQKDDVIVLLGGRTGRDGCGGATGSSKAHNSSSIEPAAQRFKRVILLRNVKSSVYSARQRLLK